MCGTSPPGAAAGARGGWAPTAWSWPGLDGPDPAAEGGVGQSDVVGVADAPAKERDAGPDFLDVVDALPDIHLDADLVLGAVVVPARVVPVVVGLGGEPAPSGLDQSRFGLGGAGERRRAPAARVAPRTTPVIALRNRISTTCLVGTCRAEWLTATAESAPSLRGSRKRRAGPWRDRRAVARSAGGGWSLPWRDAAAEPAAGPAGGTVWPVSTTGRSAWCRRRWSP